MPDPQTSRRARLRETLAARDLGAALITRLVNVRYLTGFTGSNGALLVLRDGGEVLATDGRYTTQAAAQAPDVEVATVGAVGTALVERAAALGLGTMGFEAHDVTVEMHGALVRSAGSTELTVLGRAVEALRIVKDDAEIAAIRAACVAADAAFADLLPTVRAGRSEKELSADLEARMREHGADGVSFETIVATGPHSAIPHHRPTERPVASGDLVKFDFGALVAGYHSDMTRTVVVGPAADWQRDLYALVASAQQAGIEALVAGAVAGDLDRVSRDVIDAAGHGEHYTHSLGHGVGLEIHEAPTLRAGASDTLAAGTPVTVEPGVYLPGRGGVRIEDLLVVGPDSGSAAEALTTTTKELLVL